MRKLSIHEEIEYTLKLKKIIECLKLYLNLKNLYYA